MNVDELTTWVLDLYFSRPVHLVGFCCEGGVGKRDAASSDAEGEQRAKLMVAHNLMLYGDWCSAGAAHQPVSMAVGQGGDASEKEGNGFWLGFEFDPRTGGYS